MRKILILALVMCMPLVIGCDLAKDQPASFSGEAESRPVKLFDDGTYTFDISASNLYWEAFNAVGSNAGRVKLTRGEMVIQIGQPQSGSFLVDMNSISDTDLSDEALRAELENQLKSDPFLSVDSYPTALFDITQILPYEGAGDYNYTIEGDLSLKNATQPITILAKIRQSSKTIIVEGRTQIDGAKFGIAANQLFNDNFVIEMELSADRL